MGVQNEHKLSISDQIVLLEIDKEELKSQLNGNIVIKISKMT